MIAAQQADPSQLTGIVGWIADVIATLGSVGVTLLTLLDNFFPPIPSEVVLPLAGYLASQGRLTLVGALLGSTIGSTVGAVVLHEVGRRLGRRRTQRLVTSLPLMEAEDIRRAESWFDRHGRAAVFLGRMVPGVRSLISIPAGVERMPLGTFTVLTALGSAIWNTALVGAGLLLGNRWRNVGEYSDALNAALVAAFVLLLARFVWRRRDRLRSADT